MSTVSLFLHMSSYVHSSVSQALEAGVVIRQYKIKELLSVETDCFVYLALDSERDRLVTVKEHFPIRICERVAETRDVYCVREADVPSYEKSLKAFENRTMLLSNLRHKGIPFQHHMFPEHGTLYRVANYVEGYPLEGMLHRQNEEESSWFYEEREMRGLLWRILDILDYVHGEKVWHLDLKPKFVIFTRLGNPLITHFCSTLDLFNEREHASEDSLVYFAPEQWDNSHPHGPWTDVYSLAAIFYHMVTGQAPVRADKRLEEDTMPKLAEDKNLRKKYSRNFLRSLDRALTVSPKERFQAAMDWQDFLLKQIGFSKPQWLEGVPKSRKWIQALWITAGFALFCGVLWGGYAWLMSMMDFSEPPPVAAQATEIAIPEQNAVDGQAWGMQFTLKDYGFGVNYESIPSVINLNSITFSGSLPPKEAGSPPIYLSIRTADGSPLALSENSAHFITKDPIKFDFSEKVILNTKIPYQYVFVTEEGAVANVHLKQSKVNPLTRKGALALVFNSDGKANRNIPVFKVKFEPNSGARPLAEPLPEASMAQSPGYAAPRNWCLHPGAAAKQSSVDSKAEAALAIDGQMSGDMGCLTDPSKGNGWWLVTLGKGIERPVKKVIVYNMPERGMLESRRLSNYRIELFDRMGKEVAHKDFHTAPGSWVKEDSEAWVLPDTVNAHSVRIRKLGKGAHPEDAALFLAEVEVVAPQEAPEPLPQNLIDWCQWSGVKASQSKTWRNWIATYGAHRALGKQPDERFYALTEQDNSPGWWEVDLSENRDVEYVRITNSAEKALEALRQSNFCIILKDERGNELTRKDFYTTPGDYAPLQTVWKTGDAPVSGVRSVRIEKLGKGTHPYDNALSLVRVEVLGKAPQQ